jgi:hypothetical protein
VSISVGRYTFEGPFPTAASVEDRAGVYAIHCVRDGSYYLLDIGESVTLRAQVEGSERRECWRQNCAGSLTISVLYTPTETQAGRLTIAQELRRQFRPPCAP